MRDLTKIIIALAFIAGAFGVGKYLSDEKCLSQIEDMNINSATDKRHILQLHDSLNILRIELGKEKSKNKIGTTKTRQSAKKNEK